MYNLKKLCIATKGHTDLHEKRRRYYKCVRVTFELLRGLTKRQRAKQEKETTSGNARGG
jgi:hypothetical protein